MKKIITSGFIFSTMVFAFNAEVKIAPVKLSINDLSKQLDVGDKLTLNSGDVICFTEGDGRVVIQGELYKTQLSKRSSSCQHLPGKDGKITSHYPQSISNSIVSMFQQSEEKSINGASRKNSENNVLIVPIFMYQNTKYLVIENSTWGPVPITLELYDDKGIMVKRMVNKEDIFTSFILSRKIIKEGYSIKVSNRFDDLLVKSKIHFQNIEKK